MRKQGHERKDLGLKFYRLVFSKTGSPMTVIDFGWTWHDQLPESIKHERARYPHWTLFRQFAITRAEVGNGLPHKSVSNC